MLNLQTHKIINLKIKMGMLVSIKIKIRADSHGRDIRQLVVKVQTSANVTSVLKPNGKVEHILNKLNMKLKT